jgi:putative CRISPR-associated protein (TIGR02619 family)
MMARKIVLCTVGTSLFYPNLSGLRKTLQGESGSENEKSAMPAERRAILEALATAYEQKDWQGVATQLVRLPPQERLCGAEINSMHSLIQRGYATPDCGVYFLHSDTPDGQAIGEVLKETFQQRGHQPVHCVQVTDLQDSDPKRFRTKGLRNLARELSRIIRDYTASACAINATGGYKAQIALAVLIGQAIHVPVYYMHERFSEIIAFPPMPVAFDFDYWMKCNRVLYTLEKEPRRWEELQEEWDEVLESLTEVVDINGEKWVELSATGQIFHDAFRERFHTHQEALLPPPAPKKEAPAIRDHSVTLKCRPDLERYLSEVTEALPCIQRCVTHYAHPDLPLPMGFRIKPKSDEPQIEGIYCNGRETVKFWVQTTAATLSQCQAVVASLNDWLDRRK